MVTRFILIALMIHPSFGGQMDNSETVYVSNEIQMPRVGFGTAALRRGSQTKEVLCQALNYGVRLIDTGQAAEWYTEEGVGQALSECYNTETGGDLVVVTKIHPRSYMYAKINYVYNFSQSSILTCVVFVISHHIITQARAYETKHRKIPDEHLWLQYS
jgi:diketogulonate reductase-like aldo/keto reductase